MRAGTDAQPVALGFVLDTLQRGISVVRATDDGLKRPKGNWEDYQHRLPTLDEVTRWFKHPWYGAAAVCGQVSGGLEMVEFEGRAIELGLLAEAEQLLEAAGLLDVFNRIRAGYTEVTPRGGFHFAYLTDEPLGNQKLAFDVGQINEQTGEVKYEVLAETRGEGGIFIFAPSCGPTHKSGRPWVLKRGGFGQLAYVTRAERDALFAVLRRLDRRPENTRRPSTPNPPKPSSERKTWIDSDKWMDATIADFIASSTWPQVLAGRFEYLYHKGDVAYWHYIGAENEVSATTNATGRDTLIVFSSTAGGAGWFAYDGVGKAPSYNRFDAWCQVQRGTRDDQQARTELARELREQGFGPPPRPADDFEDLIGPAPVSSPSSHNSHAQEQTGGWPELDQRAFHGPIGEFVLEASTYTEADPVALLVTLIVGYGVVAHSSAYVLAGNARHPAALYAALVGQTAKGGKGTSMAIAREVLARIDSTFAAKRLQSGFGSGEVLIDSVRDPIDNTDVNAPSDKRLMIFEPELAKMLRVMGREGSTLGAVLREMWDGNPVQTRSRGKGNVVASRYHVGVIAHITVEELRNTLTSSETYGGTANRLMWVCVKRARRLPDGGNVPENLIAECAKQLETNLRAIRCVGLVKRDDVANRYWHKLYNDMGDDDPGGLLGAVIARAEPIVLRLALAYALADASVAISQRHLEAAWALWSYCRESAAHIFGDLTGNDIADRLLDALKAAGPKGLDGTEQSALFGRHISAKQLELARRLLVARGLARVEQETTGGRPRVVMYANAKEANQAKKGRAA